MKKFAPITFCIVNFNGEQFIEETLSSVFRHKRISDEVLLIDNASKDGSLTMVQSLFPEVKIIKMDFNRGPGAARNAGFRQAAHNWICFLDNDVSLTANCVADLVAAMTDRPYALAAMPRVLFAADPLRIQYDGADAHYLGTMIIHNQGMPLEGAPTMIKRLGSIITACFLIDRARWHLGDPFDENVFIYFDDHDFALQINLSGFEVLGVPTAQVLHREGTAGLSLRRLGRYTGMRLFNKICNRWQIIWKYYALQTLLLFFPVLLIYEGFLLAAAIKKRWLKEWLRAVRWVLCNRRSLCQKRAELQKRRKVSDQWLFQDGPLPFSDYLAQGRPEKRSIELLNKIITGYWRFMAQRRYPPACRDTQTQSATVRVTTH